MPLELVVDVEQDVSQIVATAVEAWFERETKTNATPWASKAMDVGKRTLVVRNCPRERIDDLASVLVAVDGVIAVAAEQRPRRYNYNARWIVETNDPSSKATPLHTDMGLSGENVVINVNDDGIDVFSCWFRDDDLPIVEASLESTAALTVYFDDYYYYTPDLNSDLYFYDNTDHRKIRYAFWPFYDPISNPDEFSYNPGMHGSHVAGSALGSSPAFRRVSTDDVVDYTGDGIAPDAKIAFLDMSPLDDDDDDEDDLYPPANFDDVPLALTYDLGARISSNSWGSSSGEYGSRSAQIDDFCFKNQDTLVLFAAGNDGHDPNTIGSPGVAKNVLTVGASASYDIAGLDAALAATQSPTPSTIFPSRQPTSFETDGSLASQSSLSGTLETGDSLRFEIAIDETIAAVISTCGSDFDTTLALWGVRDDGQDSRLLYNDDDCGDCCGENPYTSRITSTFSNDDRYYVVRFRVLSGFAGGGGTYELSLTETTPFPTYSPTPWTPVGTVGDGDSVSGTLGYDESHYFRVSIETSEATTISVSTCGSSDFDTILRLLLRDDDGQFSEVAYDDDCYCCDTNYLASEITARLAADGDYYVQVSGFGFSGGTYELSLTVATPSPSNSPTPFQSDGTLRLGESVTGTLEPNQNLRFELIVATLSPGEAYFVSLSGIGGDGGSYVITTTYNEATPGPTPEISTLGLDEVATTYMTAGGTLRFEVNLDSTGPVNEKVRVTTCGSAFDTVLSLLVVSDEGSFETVASNDDCFCCSADSDKGYLQSGIETMLESDKTYVVVVEGKSSFDAGIAYVSMRLPAASTKTAVSTPDVVDFSSRGPTTDGRIKPDIVAPGIKQSAALKALIIAAGRYMNGTEANRITSTYSNFPTFPNYDQGFGLVETRARSFFPTTCVPPPFFGIFQVVLSQVFNQTSVFVDGNYSDMAWVNATDDVKTYEFVVEDAATSADRELRIVLSWHDPPSSLFASSSLLLNDLDLVVESANGDMFYPNFGDPIGDHVNNVERVVITDPLPGVAYTATVSVTSLSEAQPFALVAAGPFVKTASLYPNLAGACVDDAAWYKKASSQLAFAFPTGIQGDPAKDCSWVSSFVPARCAVKGEDDTWAFSSCPQACDACKDAPCAGDSTSWYFGSTPSRDCSWVADAGGNRCPKIGNDGTFAFEACPFACQTCSYDGCKDSSEWSKPDEPSRDCAWVAEAKSNRCIVVGADGTYAYESCKASCAACYEAITGSECANSASWYKRGDPSKHCDWISSFVPKRCVVKGDDDEWAFEQCPVACDTC
ncbi:hypothetical protein CTAYLR_008012 [Chrysophaeum taylorii]|uniref:subtilisin n=1 Tax=Chrysophaeum taylorii TaxID=2483200 RepID=A0AAD7UC13_9STRA|nr:hypothetical protein CTAYLR_008012 [Chrysophaeum taylorii]